MAMSHDEAVEVQRRYEGRLMAVPGVNAVGVKLRDDQLVLEITADEGTALPDDLCGPELDGLRVVVTPGRYELQ